MPPSPRSRVRPSARAASLLVVAALITALAVAVPAPAQAAGGVAREVFDLTNAERAKAGLGALASNAALDAAAGEWARYLAGSCTFAHSTSAWRSERTAPAGWTSTGENIAAGQMTASAVMAGWMASSGHRANILNGRYTGLGVGYATGSCYKTYWVQLFAIGSPVPTLPGGAGDLDSDGSADVLALTSTGDLMLYRGNGASGWKTSSVIRSGWGTAAVTTLGDFTGDGRPDFAKVEADGALMLYSGDGRGGLTGPTRIGSGWGGFTQLIGGIDFNGDRLTDVLARTASGDLLLYTGNGRGGFNKGNTKIGNGWGSMTSIFYAGDFTGDARGDIIARHTNGRLWVYPTTGRGTWGTARQIGTGWGAFTSVSSAGDFDGNGTSDVLARTATGSLVLYRADGRGGWISGVAVGSGWTSMRQIG